MRPLEAALEYARRDWFVFPANQAKRPLTKHGVLDSTTDEGRIREWWKRWPDAQPAIATGQGSGIVALDVDMSGLVNGFDSLELHGISTHPATATAHTPRGGCHLLFRWPGRYTKTVAGKLGPGLDIRGDGGAAILPPGPGRNWDPHLGFDTPLAMMPPWMAIAEPEVASILSQPLQSVRITKYAEAALDSAVKAIVTAPAGTQHETLNRECFSIGSLVAAGALPAALALESLNWAARQMSSYDQRRPWREAELRTQVRDGFLDGQLYPRATAS